MTLLPVRINKTESKRAWTGLLFLYSRNLADTKPFTQGQALVEYLVILTLSLAILMVFMRQFLNGFDKATLILGGQLEQDLKTGRVSIGIWQN